MDASGQATGRAFAQTENGSVWIGTDREGLFRVRGDTLATAQVRQITSADGLPSDRIRSVHADRQGRLWVGIGDRGLVRLDRQGTLPLKDDIVTTPPPPAAIERVATGDTTYTTVPDDTLRLRPEQRTFIARYAGLHFADPAAIQFRVRLQGFDRRPTRTDQRRVRYTEVGPGTYTLVVRAAGERDAWGEPARLTVTVAPFGWETGWFLGLCGLGLIGLAVGAYRWRTWQLRRRRDELEQTVADLHGGILTVESAEGEGTKFTASLPRGKTHLSDDQLADDAPNSQPSTPTQRSTPNAQHQTLNPQRQPPIQTGPPPAAPSPAIRTGQPTQ